MAPIVRRGTFDSDIWSRVEGEYPALPAAFAPGELVLDLGCHTGAFCALAARRGATVVGYEASFENFGLAAMNVGGLPAVSVRHAAVWRSDVSPQRLLFTPAADIGNTGGGSVMFPGADAHWRARPREVYEPTQAGCELSSHPVPSVALDAILLELGPVRFLKLDVEGAEFPILLTATRLELVAALSGEYHALDETAMAELAPGARVGEEPYSRELLRRRLLDCGFDDVELRPSVHGRGYFSARRRRPDGHPKPPKRTQRSGTLSWTADDDHRATAG